MSLHTTRPGLVNGTTARKMLGVSERTFKRMVAAGAIAPVHIRGLGRPRYRRADVEALIGGRSP